MQRFLALLFMTLLPTELVWAADHITFRIYSVGKEDEVRVAALREGILLFSQSVARHCLVNLPLEIDDFVLESPANSALRTQSGFHEESVGRGETFPFRFLQYPFYQIIVGHQLIRQPGEVSLFLVDSLATGAICGFAFPEEQFVPVLARGVLPHVYQRVVAQLTDRVLIGRDISPRDCPTQRLVAHELAHIFVHEPDGREHRCIEGDKWLECPRDNLLLSRISPDYDDPGMGRNPWRRGGGIFDDPMVPRPALGTALTTSQCQRVRATYERLLAE